MPQSAEMSAEQRPRQRQNRRQIYRRRRALVFGGVAVFLAAGFYLPATLLAPLEPVSAQVDPIETPNTVQVALGFPPFGAAGIGAVGFDGVLASTGVSTPVPIASITKVITALVVLDAHPLELGQPGADITFSAIDETFYDNQIAADGIVADVSVGQVQSQRNILDVMLMASANNYADSLANWAFGSEAAYVTAATAWLADRGFSGTSVTDATGIHPTNQSTVADLIGIAKLALANPVIAEIVATPALDVPGLGLVSNRNGLLGINGVNGIKTGTLDESGACLMFSSEQTVGTATITIVGVVLGGPNHDAVDAAVDSLLSQADAGFHQLTVVHAGDTFAQYETAWGDTSRAVATRDETIVLWSDTPVSLTVDAAALRLGTAGQHVGEVTITAGERNYSVQLALSRAITEPGIWWRLTNPAKLF